MDKRVKSHEKTTVVSLEDWKRVKYKAEQWDRLHDIISEYYDDDNPKSHEEDGLINIGEQAAMAFGFL